MASHPESQTGLAAAVLELRSKAGLTQAELGRLAGVHPSWIAQIEAGENDPSWGTVRALATGLGIPLPELARRAEELETHG